jgi:hypothetical protein
MVGGSFAEVWGNSAFFSVFSQPPLDLDGIYRTCFRLPLKIPGYHIPRQLLPLQVVQVIRPALHHVDSFG